MSNKDFEEKVLKKLDMLEWRFDWLEWRFDWLEWRFDWLEWRFDRLENRLDEWFQNIQDQLDSASKERQQGFKHIWNLINEKSVLNERVAIIEHELELR